MADIIEADPVNTVYSRLEGLYNGNVPGTVEFWTNEGIITK